VHERGRDVTRDPSFFAPPRWWRVLGIPALVLSIAACETTPFEPGDVFSPIPCALPASLLEATTGPVPSLQSLRSAVLHAAGPMSAALEGGPSAAEVGLSLAALGKSFDASNFDTVCRFLGLASTALSNGSGAGASLPDRDGIRLILSLTARALVADR